MCCASLKRIDRLRLYGDSSCIYHKMRGVHASSEKCLKNITVTEFCVANTGCFFLRSTYVILCLSLFLFSIREEVNLAFLELLAQGIKALQNQGQFNKNKHNPTPHAYIKATSQDSVTPSSD